MLTSFEIRLYIVGSRFDSIFRSSGRHPPADGRIHILPRTGKNSVALSELSTETTHHPPERGRRGAAEEEKGRNRHSRMRSPHGDQRRRLGRVGGDSVRDERVRRRRSLSGFRTRRRPRAARAGETNADRSRRTGTDDRLAVVSARRRPRYLSSDHSAVRKHRDRRAERRSEGHGVGVAGRHDRR